MLHVSISGAHHGAAKTAGPTTTLPYIDIVNIIKLDAVVSHEVVPLDVLTMVSTNFDGFGERLRPLPWPSFMCKIGQVHLM